ncbi:MAG: glycosyltransferase family 2 protein [Elusimicrobiaceae bacterium]|nr:glycosyltransferase family 2 protein [Elusimicrobiaceae bacterium]
MNETARLSLFVITKNEEKNIAKCILSARNIVNEIIVVDSFSQDKTALICRDLGAIVFEHKFENFTQQKNFALSKVSGNWALSLDADETLTPQLADEIKQAITSGQYDGYQLARVNNLWGKQMHHSGLKKEFLVRLVRTKNAKFTGGLVHEKLNVTGKVGHLKNVFEHHPYDSIEMYLQKLNHHTTLAAKTMYQNGKCFSAILTVARIPFDFSKRYFFQLGFLDGWRGFVWAALSAFEPFVESTKLWLLERK